MLTRAERGSTLLLVPTAVLVLVVLGALSVDLSAAHLAQRELVVAVQGAANDAAAAAVDEGAFYSRGVVHLDSAAAQRAARASLAANAPDARLDAVVVDVAGASVEVRARAVAPTVFAAGVPGAPRSSTVTARARAGLEG